MQKPTIGAEHGRVPEVTSGDLNNPANPELLWLHHAANGGSRGDSSASRAIRGGQLKAQGVRAGVADLFLPMQAHRVHLNGLYIEMKKPDEKPKRANSKGGLSDDQLAFRDFVTEQGYSWHVCYSWREAADVIIHYFMLKGNP